METSRLSLSHGLFDAAIVDLDGTLVDTLGDFVVALNRMLAELSLSPVERSVVGTRVGKGSEHLISSVLEHVLNGPKVLDGRAQTAINKEATAAQLFPAAWTSYQRHYLAINGKHSTVYPGVTEGLAALEAQGLRLACVTNKPVGFAKPLLEQMGLAPYFEIVYGGDSLARKKPDPMPLLQVCADFDLSPAQVVAIGDSSNDAEAARAAGCFVLTVPYGYNHGRAIHETDSDGIVSSLLEAATLISSHNNTAN